MHAVNLLLVHYTNVCKLYYTISNMLTTPVYVIVPDIHWQRINTKYTKNFEKYFFY